jgi:hypothetical protein
MKRCSGDARGDAASDVKGVTDNGSSSTSVDVITAGGLCSSSASLAGVSVPACRLRHTRSQTHRSVTKHVSSAVADSASARASAQPSAVVASRLCAKPLAQTHVRLRCGTCGEFIKCGELQISVALAVMFGCSERRAAERLCVPDSSSSRHARVDSKRRCSSGGGGSRRRARCRCKLVSACVPLQRPQRSRSGMNVAMLELLEFIALLQLLELLELLELGSCVLQFVALCTANTGSRCPSSCGTPGQFRKSEAGAQGGSGDFDCTSAGRFARPVRLAFNTLCSAGKNHIFGCPNVGCSFTACAACVSLRCDACAACAASTACAAAFSTARSIPCIASDRSCDMPDVSYICLGVLQVFYKKEYMKTHGMKYALFLCLMAVEASASCTTGEYLQGNSCLKCPEGKYSQVEGAISATTCVYCPAGKFQGETGKSVCTDCVAGTTSADTTDGGWSWHFVFCWNCNAGTYSNTGGSCLTCDAGKYQPDTRSTGCLNCPAGKYNSLLKQTSVNSCKNCPSGKYSSNIAAMSITTCASCSFGKYSDTLGAATENVCIDCPVGKTTDLEGATYVGYCLQKCEAGTYRDNNENCVSCVPGKFSGENEYQIACQPCFAGTYSTNAGSAVCQDCIAGKYSVAGATFCSPCPRNTYQPKNGSRSCVQCDVGKFSPESSASCEICPGGSVPAAEGCFRCWEGWFAAVGQTVCSMCPLGKYNGFEGSAECTDCAAGTFSTRQYATSPFWCNNCGAGTFSLAGQSVCTPCDAGKYSGVRAASCSLCEAGKYSTSASNLCVTCDIGKYSQQAAKICLDCTSVYNTYAKYQVMPVLGDQCFRTCDAESCLMSASNEQLVCAAGKGLTAIRLSTSSAGRTLTMICTECQPGYTRMILKDYDNQINFFCVMCINGVHDTSPNVPARVVPVIPGSFQRLSTGSITYAEKFTCPCGIGKITDESGLCPLSPASTYQPVEGGLTAIRCPEHSHSAPGSDSWTDCKCIDGFTPEPEYNAVGEQTSFKCFCRPGYYFSGTACVKCEICDPLTYPGYYKHGCGKLSAGECKKCEDCTNNKYRAGCRFFSAGECKNKHELVRMPFCPAVQTDNSELAVSVRQASGLGAFSFEQVFGTDAQGADFACSQPCDGVEYDTIQCDGPFACNVKTCAEKTLVGELPRACPVVIDEDDDRSMRDSKRGEACVVCSECGHANVNLRNGVGAKYNYYKHWGGGCVRECSKLMCTDNEIWDWTARRCQRCSQLRDIRLCNQGDRVSLSLQARTVTGNWPLLFFPECEGTSASKKLESFKYGVCAVCDAGSNKQELCASASEFPASCKDSQVLCESCHRGGRAGSAQAVEVFKGLWHNALSSAFEPLHCQISACTEGWTGVGSADNMCTQACEDVECTANEVSVPCRLPHQARCEAVFPGPPKGHPGGFQVENDEQYADGEVNLLNEVDDMKHRRFASFENALIVLGNAETEYQCVWNADGIFDSKTSPGGITSVFWRAGMSDDDAFKTRGTQACRVWDVDGGVELPLLPLQNTISASEIQERFNISVRRMLVNTEAYVLSYRFGGSFATPETDDVHGAFADSDHTPGERMLRGAHVGGAGRLFLMLRLHEDKATVAVTLPSDRRLHEAMWVQALLVSFAIVDVTQYFGKEESGVTVNAGMTAGGQHINDLGDNFILESFWVQELPEALSLQAQSSLFRLEVWDYASANADIAFNTWSRCSNTDMLALKILDMQVAPFIPVAASLAYSWVEAKAESAMPYNVSISCFKGAILVPDSQCIPVKDATAVYVRPKPYVYSGSSGPAICPECTTDRTLRALRNVHEHMRGVRADQHVGSAGLVRYLLNQFARRMLMLHAHAWDPFGKCIALITTVDTMHNSVLCIGAEEAVELARLPVSGPDQYIGAFGYAIDAKKHVFMLLKGRATRSTKLSLAR